MKLILIKNPDSSQRIAYKIARVVYAETCAASLRVVEALTSMIRNNAIATGRTIDDVVSDTELFESINPASHNHHLINVEINNREMQMCVRVATRMLHGGLPDCCYGATRFHRDCKIPTWAISRGYIADIDGLLFYL